jgi:carbamoyl-phosphate synthase large subunit
VNARLSRSSALASKAAGYPLAYVAAKVALGYTLAEIPNGITRRTTCFFEPALDYIVCKVPRWDLTKFQGASVQIGSEMKSVGEVMAIGRSFPEVIQKALRMVDIGVDGVDIDAFGFHGTGEELKTPTPFRVFGIAKALACGVSVDDIRAATGIDRWFIRGIAQIVSIHKDLRKARMPLDAKLLREAASLGFSDRALEKLVDAEHGSMRVLRHKQGFVRIWLRSTRSRLNFRRRPTTCIPPTRLRHDVAPSRRRPIIVLGSGAYRIGSSVNLTGARSTP